MRVVLDTNVLVSGLLTRDGTCALLLDYVTEGILTVCIDDRILGEYDRVCLSPRLNLDAALVNDFLRFLRESAEPFVAAPIATQLPDPDDLPFLDVAAAAEATLTSGNTRHYPEKCRGGVRLCTPAELLALLRQ